MSSTFMATANCRIVAKGKEGIENEGNGTGQHSRTRRKSKRLAIRSRTDLQAIDQPIAVLIDLLLVRPVGGERGGQLREERQRDTSDSRQRYGSMVGCGL
jgi:hypothetical protein